MKNNQLTDQSYLLNWSQRKENVISIMSVTIFQYCPEMLNIFSLQEILTSFQSLLMLGANTFHWHVRSTSYVAVGFGWFLERGQRLRNAVPTTSFCMTHQYLQEFETLYHRRETLKCMPVYPRLLTSSWPENSCCILCHRWAVSKISLFCKKVTIWVQIQIIQVISGEVSSSYVLQRHNLWNSWLCQGCYFLCRNIQRIWI